jgi:hypothetical protein
MPRAGVVLEEDVVVDKTCILELIDRDPRGGREEREVIAGYAQCFCRGPRRPRISVS